MCLDGTVEVLNQESENKKKKGKSGKSNQKYLNSYEWFFLHTREDRNLISFHQRNQIKCENTGWKDLWKSFPMSYRTPKIDIRIESYEDNTVESYSSNADAERTPRKEIPYFFEKKTLYKIGIFDCFPPSHDNNTPLLYYMDICWDTSSTSAESAEEAEDRVGLDRSVRPSTESVGTDRKGRFCPENRWRDDAKEDIPLGIYFGVSVGAL